MKKYYFLFLTLVTELAFAQVPMLNTPADNATINGISTPLDWFDVVGESGYIYQIDIVNTFDSNRVITLTIGAFSGSDYPTIYLSNLSFGTTYYWRVATQNGTSQSAWSEIRSFITIAQPTLQSPENNSIIDNATANLTWNDVNGETGYVYQYDIVDTFDSANLVNRTVGEHTSGTALPSGIADGLTPETTYYWRVAILNNSNQSGWSPVWTFNTGDTANTNSITADTFSIYPNPVKDLLHFSNVPNDSNIAINSIEGKLILSGKANNNSPLNLDNLPAGIYLITIEKDGQKAIKKFVKQ
jgi:hypothetical protein